MCYMGQITLLLRLYISPLKAFSRIIDEARLIFALLAAVGVMLALQVPRSTVYYRQQSEKYSQEIKAKVAAAMQKAKTRSDASEQPAEADGSDDEDDSEAYVPALRSLGPPPIWAAIDRFTVRVPTEYFPPLLAVAICFVPAVILVLTIWEHLGGFSTILFRDYMTLLVCCLMGWSAAYLPLAVANGYLLWTSHPLADNPALWWAAHAYFLLLVVVAIRTVSGTRLVHALGAAGGAWGGAVGGLWLHSMFGGFTAYLASPFVLYYLYQGLAPEFRSLGTGLRSRQRLKERLENATLNPRDADAHYQLGLIYQQRRQYEAAIERFRKAIAVDPDEADAYFQLGRIAREQGNHSEALEYYRAAARIDDKHASSEVWREIGVASLLAGDCEAARQALEKYLDRRPYDPEGDCWYGRVLAQLGRGDEARAAFEQAIEAVRTMPVARKRKVRSWESEARREMKKLPAFAR
jgi:tetratricopeptide (TPR) repeat protein